ncbi:MAG: hypothetical protein JWM31_841 [Solirubrobacterales bacterium]|nr:hypothetical protein [Solirubrobacterales bacterium]
MVRKLTLLAGTLAVTAAAPAAASAAAPSVSTGGASKVTTTTAHLAAKVNPRGQSTTYSFQYGTGTTYGATTAVASAGSGTQAITVGVDLAGLQGATTYHFRVVASSPGGVVSGADRTFRTSNVPLSLTLGATPNPVRYGGSATLNGVLAGTGGGGRTIQIQQNAFPYTGGFVNAPISPVVTNKDGAFSTVLPSLLVNTQVRAVTTTGTKLASEPIIVGVTPTVRTAVSTRHPRRNTYVRFAGTVTPVFVPAQVAIQRKSANGAWITVAGVVTRADTSTRSRYAKSAKIRSAGTYRVFVGLVNSQFAGATGPEIRITPRSTK